MSRESKTLLESVIDGVLTAHGFPAAFEEPPRMTIHTANHSFTGPIDIEQKKGLTLVTVGTNEGEIGVPYGSIEYMEHAEQEVDDE